MTTGGPGGSAEASAAAAKRAKAVDVARRVRAAGARARAAARAWADRVDPNDDPDAEPISFVALAALVAATTASVVLFWWFHFQPMQDLGHHAALAAVVADYGRAGSIYPALYEPFDPLNANALLYVVAGLVGRVANVTWALKLCLTGYLVGVPLANAYALRVFGRSLWGAVLAPLLVYNMSFVAGFANLLFAAPLLVLALPLGYRLLRDGTRGAVVRLAVLLVLLLLAHAHAFLWTGAMLFVMTLVAVVARLAGAAKRPRRPAVVAAARTAGAALVAVTPALLLFTRWYARTFGERRAEGGVLAATSGIDNAFGAWFKPASQLWADLVPVALRSTRAEAELRVLVLLAATVVLAAAFAGMRRSARPPVMELAFLGTALSYFVLPEGLTGHDVLGSRQPGIALWLLPAMVTPPARAASRLARAIVVAMIVVTTWGGLSVWSAQLVQLTRVEARGLADVLAAAPPRKWLHYVKLDPDSAFFPWRPFWHVEKLYMSEKLGQTADTPAILSTSPIRYRAGVDVHRIGEHTPDWPDIEEIWASFDLVLLRRWDPTARQRARAEERWALVVRSGDWELWQRKEPAQK